MAIQETGLKYVYQDIGGFLAAAEKSTKAINSFGNAAASSGPKLNVMQEIATGALRSIGSFALDAATKGILAFGDAITGGISDAKEARIIMAQTQQVIESTGSAAGLTADQIATMASQMSAASGKSLFGDDLIQRGQNVLLTFTQIGKDVFPLATQASLDMAQALNKSPEVMSMLIGKALNSAEGFSALTRSGVAFTEAQEEMIKGFFAAGDAASAQKIILAELATEFGGQAEAAAKADGGMAQFHDRLGEVMETIGAQLLPLLDAAAVFFNETLAPAIEYVAINAFPALESAWHTVEPGFQFVIDNSGPISAALVAMGTAILISLIPPFIAWASAAATAATATIIALAPVLIPIAAIGAAAAALKIAWDNNFLGIRDITASVWAVVEPIFTSVKTWLGTNIPIAVSTVSKFFTETLWPALNKVWSFLNTYIIPIFTALAAVHFAALSKAAEVLAALWTNVLWPALQKVWDFLSSSIIPVFKNAGEGAATLGGVINDNLGPAFQWLDSNVLGPVRESFNYISDAVQGVIRWLNDLAKKIENFEVPGWLRGESPPPMADWWRYIGEAIEYTNTIAARASEIWAGLLDADQLAGMTKEMIKYREEQLKLLEELPDAIEEVTQRARDFLRKMNDNFLKANITGFGTMIDNLRATRDAFDEVADAQKDATDASKRLNKALEDGDVAAAAAARTDIANAEARAKALGDIAYAEESRLEEARQQFLTSSQLGGKDAENAQALFNLKSKQIRDLADIERQLASTTDARTRGSLINERNFLIQQQKIEMDLFNSQAQARVDSVEESIQRIADAFAAIEFPDLGDINNELSVMFHNLTDLIGRLSQMQLPPWLTPGSPTPLEMGIRGISSAMQQMSTTAIPSMRMELNRSTMLANPGQIAASSYNYAPVTTNNFQLATHTNNSPHQVYQSFEIMRSLYGGRR